MKFRFWSAKFFALSLIVMLSSSCGQYNDISVKGIKDVKFKGINKKVVMLSFDVEIDNPNFRKITVVEIELKAWLNNRELGTFRIAEPIRLIPCSKQSYSIPAEIELRTLADAFRLATSGSVEGLLDKIEVEGRIKGRSFPVRKIIKIDRQSFKVFSSSL